MNLRGFLLLVLLHFINHFLTSPLPYVWHLRPATPLVDPEKKNCDLTQTGAIFRQED